MSQATGSAGPGDRLLVGVLGMLAALAPASIDIYLPAFPAIARSLDAPASAVQLTLTAFLLGMGAGQLVAGAVSDAIGRRRPLLAGLALYVVASLACAAAPGAAALAGLRLLQGLAGAAGIVMSRAVVRDVREGVAAARVLALLIAASSLAPILAPLAGGALLRLTSWRGVFVVLAAFGALTLAVAAVWLPETLPTTRRRPSSLGASLRSYLTVARHRDVAAYGLANALSLAAMFVYIAGSPFVYQDLHGASPLLFAVLFAVNSVGIVAAGRLGAGLVARHGPRRLLLAGLGVSAAGGALLLGAVAGGVGGLAGVAVPLFLVVATVGIVQPNATALALAPHPDAAGSAAALLGAAQFGVAAAAAPLAGLVGTRSALPMALAIAALSLAALVAALAAPHAGR